MSTTVQNILAALIILSDLLAAFSASFENEKLRHYFSATAICLINAVLFALIGGE